MTNVVALPVGPFEDACIGTVNFNSCAEEATAKNATANYITICCDGGIINTNWSIWAPGGLARLAGKQWMLDDFACCERDVWDTPDITTCSEGTYQTPLASLAGTNTDNFQVWTDTYLIDMAQTPRCAWISVAGELTTVTVARQTGIPDTTKATGSYTTGSGSPTESSTPARPTAASTSPRADATGKSSAPAAAQSTSDSSRIRAPLCVLLAVSAWFVAAAI